MDEVSINWIKERINDKKHFTARWLETASKSTGQSPENLAKIFAIVLFLILALADKQGHIITNSILVFIPFLLIFVYPDEKPTDSSLFIYFTTFGFLTVLDRNFENIPLYYVIKLILLLLLYLPPFNLAEVLDEQVKKLVNNDEGNDKNKDEVSKKKESLRKEPSKRETLQGKTEDSAPPAAQNQAEPQELITPRPAMESKSGSDLAAGSQRIKQGDNPMASGSFHNLKSEPDGFNSKLIGPENNLHDLVFFPMNALVFNAPFDFENLTYHMKIRNNAHHRIAYAIKGNAVPRVMCYPPMGIFELKETKIIAVTVQKFDWNCADFENDRIALDYVILPDNNKDKKFSMKMFQDCDSKRRKNIKILYNP